jgi:uncharacterized protein (TIGR03790 family)
MLAAAPRGRAQVTFDGQGDGLATNSDLSPYLPPTNAPPSGGLLQEAPALPAPPSVYAAAPAEPAAPVTDVLVHHFTSPEGSPEQLAQHLLVVYNSRDPDSKALADYYAEQRSLAADHVLGIDCPIQEEITRKQYEENVREPIISYIYEKNWMERRSERALINNGTITVLAATRNDIWAMVLMRGVPLRIAEDPNVHGSMEDLPRMETNAAAVDSELALLPMFGFPPGGVVPNLFYDEFSTGLVRAGPELATKLILVTRLDGPTPADVHRMIDDSLYAEENRLAGLAVIDSRGITDPGDPYRAGDEWLKRARGDLEKGGWSVYFDDKPDVLPATDPCNRVALYLGWYHEGAIGPWITPPDRFVRGAIAYHLHSFSATTVRSPTTGWVGPLLAHGAAATMGCVYEPYLEFTPHLDIFTHRLLAGNYFAEAAYACQRGLSWMVTVVGDPLYRPFKQSIDAAVAGDEPPSADHYDWLLLQQTQLGVNSGEIPDTVESLEHELDVPGAVAQEGLGDLLAGLTGSAAEKATVRAYREAGTLDRLPVDQIRVGLKLGRFYQAHGKSVEAANVFSTLRGLHPAEAAAFAVPGATIAPVARPSSSPPPVPAQDLRAPGPPGPPGPPTP